MIIKSIPLAINSLRRNLTRTILTVIGIVIGITAVIMVMSAGQAIRGLIVGEVEAFGSNYIQVEVKTPQTDQNSTENAFGMVGGVTINTLTQADAEELAKNPNVKQFYTMQLGQSLVTYQSELKKAMLFGVNAAFIDIDSTEIEQGRFFSKEENNSLAKVIVIGPKLKEQLFGPNEAIGKAVKVGKENYTIVGVTKERGATFGFDFDSLVYIPIKTLQKRILGINYVSSIIFEVHDTSVSDQTKADFEFTLRDRHDITNPIDDDFAVTTQEEALQMVEIVIVGIEALLIVLASISLIVGGIGIMNIMYVSVTERTYEIGLRKSVGARRKDILTQFLMESIFLTSIGAILGFILGALLSWLIAIVATSQGFEWQFSISLSGVGLSIGMTVGVGLLFGLYPAKKAADLEPIQALRK